MNCCRPNLPVEVDRSSRKLGPLTTRRTKHRRYVVWAKKRTRSKKLLRCSSIIASGLLQLIKNNSTLLWTNRTCFMSNLWSRKCNRNVHNGFNEAWPQFLYDPEKLLAIDIIRKNLEKRIKMNVIEDWINTYLIRHQEADSDLATPGKWTPEKVHRWK